MSITVKFWCYILFITFTIGFVGGNNYTTNEKNELKKFRSMISDVIVHDYENKDNFLMTWLRAKDMDADAAAKKFREAQKWRKENKIDTISNETMSQFKRLPYSLSGFDLDGNTILVFTPTQLDVRRLVLSGYKDKVVRMTWQMMERTAIKRREASQKSGKEIGGSVTILDFNGFNLRQHMCLSCLPVYTEWMSALEKYYPARIKHFVMIGVPQIAVPIVDLIRPIMSPSTEKVFKVFSSHNKKEATAYLLKIAASDQIPSSIGGTLQNS